MKQFSKKVLNLLPFSFVLSLDFCNIMSYIVMCLVCFNQPHIQREKSSLTGFSDMIIGILEEKELKEIWNSSLWKLSAAIFGGFLFALSYRVVIVPLHLFSGGFTGISQIILSILQKIFHFSLPEEIDITGILLWCLNIPQKH